SASSLASKEREINRLLQDIASIQSKRADIEKKLAGKTAQLHKAEEQLTKEQEREQKKAQDAAKKQQREMAQWQKKLSDELAHQKHLTSRVISSESYTITPSTISRPSVQHDVFISHASEDKEA